MTQADFDRLPLLLHWGQVCAVLSEVPPRKLETLRDEALKPWHPDPARPRMAYYLKRDVARLANLQVQHADLPRLNGWLARGELLALLGLSRRAYFAATKVGTVKTEHGKRLHGRLKLLICSALRTPPSALAETPVPLTGASVDMKG